jgi:hypothetical protein
MSMQVSRVWWDGDKLMAEPISADQVYKPEPVTEWLTCPKCSHKSPYSPIKAKTLSEDEERITKQARAALAAERQAQQEPVAFIDMSQWPPIRWRDGMIRSDVAAFDGQPLVICGHRPQAREPVGRTDQEIVDETEALAKWLMAWSFNHHPTTKAPIRQSEHPFAKSCWAAACHIQEMLTATDPENAVAELDEVAKCRHCHGIGYDASGYACSCTQEAT